MIYAFNVKKKSISQGLTRYAIGRITYVKHANSSISHNYKGVNADSGGISVPVNPLAPNFDLGSDRDAWVPRSAFRTTEGSISLGLHHRKEGNLSLQIDE